MRRWPRAFLVGMTTAVAVSACGGRTGASASQRKWACADNLDERLEYSCRCIEEEDGSVDARCSEVAYECCWYFEERHPDDHWVGNCQCVRSGQNNAAQTCGFAASIAEVVRDGDERRSWQMVDACPP